MSKKNLLEDGTVLTLGLVGVVTAVGAMRKHGSATTIEPKSPDERAGMYELVAKTQTRALWKKTYGKTLWMITDYEGNATLPYGQQDDYPTVFATLTRAMKVWNTLSSGGAVGVTNAEALRGLGFNGQGRGSRAHGSPSFVPGDHGPLRSPFDAKDILYTALRGLTEDAYWVLLLDRANRPIALERLGDSLEPRQVMRLAIQLDAVAVVVAHVNAPGGAGSPSLADLRATRALVAAGTTLGVRVVDHFLFAGEMWASFALQGLLSVE